MVRLAKIALVGVTLLLGGCSADPPVVLTAPDAATLESLRGKRVTLEGVASEHKAGDVLESSGHLIIMDYCGAAHTTWPTTGAHIRVTGILAVDKDRLFYTFRLQYPQIQIIEIPSR